MVVISVNNEFDKKNVAKKKNRKSNTYELELYFKNNIKNNKNNKKNDKKNKNKKKNTTQITKILVNDEMISETSIKKDNMPLVKEITLVKKQELIVSTKSNTKEAENKEKVINNDIYNKSNEIQVDDCDLVKKKKFFLINLFNKKKKSKYRRNDKKDKIKKNIINDELKHDNLVNNDENLIKKKNNQKEKIEANEILKEINKNNRKRRRKKYLKESLLFTIIILLIDIILYFITDYVSILRLFDIEYLNIIVTIVIVLLLLFIGSFIIDYLISELLIEFKRRLRNKKVDKIKNKQNVSIIGGGDLYRNQRFKQEKHRENCKNKK